MILSVRIDNYMIYSNDVELSLFADDKLNSFDDNVYLESGFRVLKSACVYGANNSGKTCLIKAIKCLKDVILNRVVSFQCNAFIEPENKVSSLGVSFIRCGRAFSYDLKYDSTVSEDDKNETRGFVYECFEELFADRNPEILFCRDLNKNEFFFKNEDASEKNKITENILMGFPTDRALIYGANDSIYKGLARYKEILVEFAKNLEIIDTNKISYKKTVLAMAGDSPLKKNIVELIKLADLDINDFLYVPAEGEGEKNRQMDIGEDSDGSYTKYLTIAKDSLWSCHRNIAFRSLYLDSVGTQKIIAMAGYIVDALQNGKTLVVDEFDSGLHFKLTRALVLLFNSMSNDKGGQLIFSTHDVTLLDCELLLRQDQIWFVCEDEETECLYSLAELGYSDDEISSTYNLMEKYKHGDLGPIPRPDFPALDFDDAEMK